MTLVKYKKKRNFKKTLEPKAKKKSSGKELIFVVQRHKASHLHYDFRLEMDGVLKSWAVPKGPSLNPDDKRLAMMVEDHPYDYKNFKGVIPEGNYGAGIVEIWDEGTYSDIERSDGEARVAKLRAGLKAGNLKFKLNGKKLKGDFALVKLKGKQDNAWLLIKHKDKYSVDQSYNSEDNTPAGSPINKWLEKNPLQSGKRVKKYFRHETHKLQEYIEPMLAKETDKPFDDKEWIYEIKWDGYRAIAEVNRDSIRLYSRNGNSFNAAYPIIVEELSKIKLKAILDGEVVVTDENGRASFQALQDYGNNPNTTIQYYIFDLLSLDGKSTISLPLLDRKMLLKKLIPKNDVLKYSDHVTGKGKSFFKVSEKRGLEGIMAKKAESNYYPGRRSSEWLKIKHHKTREAIIAGFTKPAGSRKHFGALVLGVKSGNSLKYVGHTGTGFNEKTLQEVYALMEPLKSKSSPFDEVVKTNMPVTWIKPQLVCEIKFSEETSGGIMRHPVFLHMRPDKSVKDVSEEAPRTFSTSLELTGRTPSTGRRATDKINSKGKKIESFSFGKINVQLSNPDKIFWPDEKITKGDVASYYQQVADYILPYLKNRPESLKRTPNGINDKGFFHKDTRNAAPEWVKTKKIFSESSDKDINYLICNNKATLLYLNNLGCIEINPWHSTVQALDKPDYMIIDIDPSDGNSFSQVIETANVVHAILKKAKAESYCKTSGATGVHVYVPLGKRYTYDQVKDFAHLVCSLVQEQLPDFTTLERNLSKRGKKMIYLDHLQNRRGQTIAAAYSLRPVPGVTVSMPLKWSEVKEGLSPNQFTIHSAIKRMQKLGDIFSGVLGKGIDIQKCLSELEK